MKPFIRTCLLVSFSLHPILPYPSQLVQALPPPEDIPEEILRTEIILEGRSPIDGQPLSAREYEELKAQLAHSTNDPKIDSNVRHLIFLLQVNKFLKTVIPFY